MTDFEFGEGLFDIFATEEDDNAPREHYDPSISRSLPSHLEERQKSNFVGLRNQGATCYLNSLLQAMFMTPEFRAGVFSLQPDEVKEDEVGKEDDVDPIQKEQLISMGFLESMAIRAIRKFPKPDQEVQRIEWMLSVQKKHIKKRILQKIPRELQLLFASLALTNQRAVSTEDLTKSFGWTEQAVRQQHDVHELNRVLFDAIEIALRNTSGKSLITDLYGGISVNKYTCLNCGNIRERTENFQDLNIHLYGNSNVLDSLSTMIAYEPLVGDNQYHCDACQRRVDALLNVSYRKLPESGTRIKNTRDFKFPMALDMFPFTEESLARRPLPKTVEEALTMGSKEFGRLELPLLVDDDSNTKTESTEKLFEGRFDPESPHLYDLTNVVIHVGGDAGFGHYHAYIRDMLGEGNHYQAESKEETEEKEGKEEQKETYGHWFDFNDSSVEPIPAEKIAEQYGGKGECAYMAIYRSKRSREKQAELNVEVPPELRAKVAQKDKEAEEKRREWKEAFFKVSLTVNSDRHYKKDVSTNRLIERSDDRPSLSGICTSTGYNIIKSDDYEFYANDNDTTAIDGMEGLFDGFLGGDEEAGDTVDVPKPAPPEPTTQSPPASKIDETPSSYKFDLDKRDSLESFIARVSQVFDKIPQEKLRIDRAIHDRVGRIRVLCPIYNARDGPCAAVTLDDIQLEASTKLLVWDGENLLEEPYDPRSFLINLNIYLFTQPQEEPMVFPLSIPESATFLELKQELEKLTEFPPKEQYITSFQGSRVSVLPSRDDFKSLFEMRIQDNDNLSVEMAQTEKDWKSLAAQYTQQTNGVLSVRVYNYCENTAEENGPGTSVQLTLSKDNTLEQVMVQALSLFGSSLALDDLQLRRMKDKPGGIYGNNTLMLKQVGLSEGGDVILEKIAFPTVNGIELKFVFGMDDKKHLNDMPLICKDSWTLRQVKEAVCAIANLDPKEHRLQKTNFWKKPQKLYDNEDLLVKQLKFSEGDTLWIEGGGAPIKGQVRIAIDLYTVSPEAAPKDESGPKEEEKPEGAEAGPKEEAKPERSEASPKEEMQHTGGEAGPKEGEPAANEEPSPEADGPVDHQDEEAKKLVKQAFKGRDTSLYSPLLHLSNVTRYEGGVRSTRAEIFSFDFSFHSTLLELKQKVHAHPAFSHLPNCHYLRLWNHAKVLKLDDVPLKRQSISHDAHLTVQVLQHEDLLTKAPSNTIRTLFLVHQRDSEKKTFGEPFEYFYDGNSSMELGEKLSDVLDIPKERLMVAHYQYLRDAWELLFYGEDPEKPASSTTEVQPGPEATTNPGTDEKKEPETQAKAEPEGKTVIAAPTTKRQRKRQRQWIPDGSILAVKDLWKDMNNDDDFTMMGMNPHVEDSGVWEPQGRPKRGGYQRGQEAVLKIYVADEEFEWVSEDESDSN